MKRLFHIAWTIDDGPTHLTFKLIDALRERQVDSITFFVSSKEFRSNQRFQDLAISFRSTIEIGIHELHPLEEEINWLPRAFKSYERIEFALADLDTFIKELQAINISPSFVRLPGGELSELIWYLRLMECPEHDCFRTARDIIDGKKVDTNFAMIKKDYDSLQHALSRRNLKIWNGSGLGFPLLGGESIFSYNSWQAESAGVKVGRGADNISLHQAKARSLAGVKEINFGAFEKLCEGLLSGRQNEASLVVLSHDKTDEDIEEILADIDQINSYARAHNIEVRFHTLTTLYRILRERNPAKRN